MRKAYLFDIDGTLLRLKNKANRTIIKKLLSQFGITHLPVEELDFAGKTDRDIFSSLLEQPDEVLFEEVKQQYISALKQHLTRDDIHIYDGVTESIAYLKDLNMPVGLLTGNFEDAATAKLRMCGLDRHFTFGAYGDRHKHRNNLSEIALQRLSTYTDEVFPPSSMIIIGDTPRDIECAKHVGAVAVAVATGNYSVDELRTHQPDAVLSSLRDFIEWDQTFTT